MSGPDIFISYARSDEEVARLFALAFEQEGFSVWWDAALHSGETFDEVIEKELRAARAVVVLWSPRSVASRWVRAEATLADRNKTLAPAIIEPCERPIIFELTHTVDLTGWRGDTGDPVWQAYLHDIRRLVGEGRGAASAASPSASPTPSPRLVTRPMPRPPSSAAPPRPALEGPAGADMESLLSAISSLQQALGKPGAPAAASPRPAPGPHPGPGGGDESDATQIYTSSDVYAMIEGDELHCLELVVEGGVEQRYVVGPLGLRIGRKAPADVILADGKVSRAHCALELRDGLLYVTDLKSTNGTYVDGRRVEGSAVLPVGSSLLVGRFALVHAVRTRDELRS